MATAVKPAIAPLEKLDSAIAPLESLEDKKVLVQYNPGLRPLGEYTSSRLIMILEPETDTERLVLVPGIQEIPAEDWEKWASCQQPIIKQALDYGVIRFASDKTDLAEIEGADHSNSFQAQEILRYTSDLVLLSRWAQNYENMSPVLREAMDMKNEALSAGPSARKRFVFGRQVA